MELDIVDSNNEKIGKLNACEDVFGAKVNEHLLHQVVVMQLANRRSGSASTKGRKEVRGGGKKPWKQKGTGRARAGSSRSPLWRGGGTVFGPLPRDYSYKVPKKVAKAALRSVISLKAEKKDIIVLDKLELESPKTKEVVLLLKKLNILEEVLFLTEAENRNLILATKNLPKAHILSLAGLNVYDLLHASKLVLTQDVVAKVEERLKK